jgi:hypothetical protein
MKLLTAAGGAVTGTAIEVRGGLSRDKSQLYTLYVWGAMGGATVTVQISPDTINWFGTGVAITAQGAQNCEFRTRYVRAVSSGGVGSSIDALLL